MTDAVTISFSTINGCLQPNNSHNWLNKQMGVQVPDYGYFAEGKNCHRIIQDHVSGIKEDERLAHIPLKFELVEEIDRDPKMEFSFDIADMAEKVLGFRPQLSKRYVFHGFRDGLKEDYSAMLEIKSSSTLWSVGQFLKALQRKCYGLDDRLKEAYLITCPRTPETWNKTNTKYFKIPFTHKDQVDAIEWILAGVGVLEQGDFTGGLEDGVCTMPRCSYGHNCQFK